MEQNYTKIEHELPLIPLRGLAIFPYMILNFDVGREMSLKALDAAMQNEDLIFLTSQKAAETDEPTEEDFYHVGTICKVKQMIKLPGDTVRVLVEGISRGKIKEVEMLEEGYYKAVIEEIAYDDENAEEDIEIDAFIRNIFDAFEEYINIGNRVSPEILISLADIDNADRFIDTIAANIYLKPEQKQQILEEFDVKKRLELIYTILLEEIDILKIEKKITLRVKKQMNKVQKDYYLREITVPINKYRAKWIVGENASDYNGMICDGIPQELIQSKDHIQIYINGIMYSGEYVTNNGYEQYIELTDTYLLDLNNEDNGYVTFEWR